MQSVPGSNVKKLVEDPISFAIMMDNMELEQVIAVFVAVLNKRKPYRGG